jgi:hypothetical protein
LLIAAKEGIIYNLPEFFRVLMFIGVTSSLVLLVSSIVF